MVRSRIHARSQSQFQGFPASFRSDKSGTASITSEFRVVNSFPLISRLSRESPTAEKVSDESSDMLLPPNARDSILDRRWNKSADHVDTEEILLLVILKIAI